MAVVSVTEIPLDESTGSKVDQSIGRGGVRRFHVLFDTASAGNAVLARLAVGVPKIGQPHPNDVYMWASSSVARPDGDTRLLYLVEVTYTSARGGEGQNANPITRPPIINWDWELSSEPIDQDPDGNPIVTINGELYDPPVMEDVADQKLIIERNYADFDPYVLQTYRYVVNSDEFLGFPAGTALMKPIRARSQTEGAFLYWAITVEVVFRVDPAGVFFRSWYRRLIQRGFLVRPGVGQTPRRAKILDSDGATMIDSPVPVLLKADGTLAATPSQAGFLYHKRYPALPFAGLNLL